MSQDRRTLVPDFWALVATGTPSPGLMVVRESAAVSAVVAYLELAAHVAEADEYAEQVTYIP